MRYPELLSPLHSRRMAGASLLELLAVIGIVAILGSIGISTYKNMTATSRVAGEINGLLGDMQYARSEAIKQGQNVVVCAASAGANNCVSGDTNWDQGWIVFIDPTGGKTTGNNAAVILRRQVAFTGTDTLSDGSTTSISYDREGLAVGFTATTLLLHTTPTLASKTRCLLMTSIGGVSVQQPSTLASCT